MTRSTLSASANRRSSILTVAALAAGLAAPTALTGCSGEGDVDRTQPDKVAKAIFFNADGSPKTFYYRQTIIGVPPTSAWMFEGLQMDMHKIRFSIDATHLVGYRSFDYAPGSENPFTGGPNNENTPVVKYAIKSHFDVKREYNPATGEQTNVINENASDLDPLQRKYMRVDWSKNLAEEVIEGVYAPGDWFLPTTRLPADSIVTEKDIADPNRLVVTDSYIDFTSAEIRTPDYEACMNMFNGVADDGGPWTCGPAEIKVRNSFMAVKPSTYEPLEYPDKQPLLDNDGKPIRLLDGWYPCTKEVLARTGGQYSGADCGPASVEQFSKFGYFRTVRQAYDKKVGATEDGRLYLANRWNIWDDTIKRDDKGNPVLDAAGNPTRLSFGERKTRQIVYYLNVEYPDDKPLTDMAKTVAGDWNEAMKQTVAALTLTERAPNEAVTEAAVIAKAATLTDDVIVVKPNTCNLTGVKTHLAKYSDLDKLVEQHVGLEGDDLDKEHLVQACSVMEAATLKLADKDEKKFTWQRIGDLRYSFFHWVDRPQAAGPLGYGPSSPDPETGEIISATAFNYGAALNVYAQTAVETVDLLNNQISVDDILSGKTITDVMQDTTKARQLREAQTVTPEAKAHATTLLRRGGTGTNRLIPIAPGASTAKIDSLKGTPLERQLLTPDILAVLVPKAAWTAAGTSPFAPDALDKLDPRTLDKVSLANLLSPKVREQRKERFNKLAMNGCVYMAEFADDAIIGLALELKQQGLNKEDMYNALRSAIFRGLADHEMGHTMGLRHNFSGSTDALNYKDQFWNIREKLPKAEWAKNKLREYQYSTVMDYGAKFNSDVHGLGKYDHAAIRFGYGQLIDTMPEGAQAMNMSGANLANEIFVSDYTRLPQAVGGVANLSNGGIMRYGPLTESLRQAYMTLPASGGGFLTPERPYKFCGDEYNGNLDCKTWDEGANQTEIVQNTIDRFRNYYFFSAYQRGRINWSLDGYFSRLADRYFPVFTQAFQFYYFFGDYLEDYDLSGDLLKASVDSLNTLGEVLQTPEPGMHCPTQINPNLLVLPSADGPNACLPQSQSMNIELPDGKPYYIDFSDHYYYRITRAGSLYEKLAAMIAMTSTEARFFRVDTFADSNRYSINYYRLFKDEMLNLLSGVIRNDSSTYGGYETGGQFTPTPVVDLNTFGKVKFDMPAYMKPGVKRIATPVNKTIQYFALLLSLGQLDSTWDSTLDISNYMAVTQKGAVDDVTYGASTVVREFTHPVGGVTYRAPQFEVKHVGIGVQVIDELNEVVGDKTVAGSLPTKYGIYNNAPLPNWWTAKQKLEAAKLTGTQQEFQDAQTVFEYVDYLLAYRVDLLNDLRTFRKAFGY